MIFLIQYNRRQGEMALFREFADSDKAIADEVRLQLELELNELDITDEVVVRV